MKKFKELLEVEQQLKEVLKGVEQKFQIKKEKLKKEYQDKIDSLQKKINQRDKVITEEVEAAVGIMKKKIENDYEKKISELKVSADKLSKAKKIIESALNKIL